MIASCTRALWPRHDIDRICFFDNFISTTIVGRTLATIGELCFISQIKIAFIALSKDLHSLGRGHEQTHRLVQNFASASWWIIAFAQCCCWRCVTTGFPLWSALEESIWTVVFTLFMFCAIYFRFLVRSKNDNLHREFGTSRLCLNLFIFSTLLYIWFMTTIDVPMYIRQVQINEQNGREYVTFFEGLKNSLKCNSVSKNWSDWWEEAQWQTPYFTLSIWMSLLIAAQPWMFKPKHNILKNCEYEAKKHTLPNIFEEEKGELSPVRTDKKLK